MTADGARVELLLDGVKDRSRRESLEAFELVGSGAAGLEARDAGEIQLEDAIELAVRPSAPGFGGTE